MSLLKPALDPSSLKLVLYPHPSLLTKSEDIPVNELGFVEPLYVRAVANRMMVVLNSMGSRGIGLAANQVGLTYRIFICMDNLNVVEKTTKVDHALRAYINPEIIEVSDDRVSDYEGCLSLPGIRGKVSRPSTVTMSYLDLDGNKKVITASGLQGRCFLHEINHLDGINIVEHFDAEDTRKNSTILKKLKPRK